MVLRYVYGLKGESMKTSTYFQTSRRSFALSALVLGASSLLGCRDGSNPAAPSTSAGESSSASLSADSRVVAVTRSIADLWILSGGALVGATDDAIEYFGLGSETTSIGTISKPNLEAIVALDPDLIVFSEELSIHEELAKQLETQNFEVMRVSVESFEDYTSIMQELTGATGRDDLYQQHVANVSAAVDDVRQQATASVAELAGKRSFLALLVSATKNKVLKDDYFACEIFRDMGLTNVATDNSPLDDLSLEAIVAADPAYIFVIPRGKEDEAQSSYEEAFASQPVWQSLPAVAEGRLWQLPKDLFQYKPNARWAEAYEHVLELIHG